MISSPPPEATHYRGKTLTPESPVPVHIPEAQNIPILRNQIDPIFNLVSTHMALPTSSQASFELGHTNVPQNTLTVLPQTTESVEPGYVKASKQIPDDYTDGLRRNGSRDYELVSEKHDLWRQEPDNSEINLTSNTQPSTSAGDYESLSILAHNELTQSTSLQSHHSATDAFENTANSTRQDVPVSLGSSTGVIRPPDGSQTSDSDVNGEGVNYQALLDTLSPSNSTVPPAGRLTLSATASLPNASDAPRSNDAQTPIATLPIPAGLPPRPPPQEKPAIHPNYTPGEDIRSYHNPPAQPSNVPSTYKPPSSNSYGPPQGYPPNNAIAANGLPPPPLATFQQSLSKSNQPQRSPQTPHYRQRDNFGRHGGRQAPLADEDEDEHARTPEVERQYEDFLREEAIYVSEGTWDRFPQGSRLFVGNLYTEQATKRDLFYVFHKYGRLAQISMKSAYGFIQYHDANACFNALQREEGVEIRGRKIHLEISKPQKNSRNAATTIIGDSLRAGHNRRSRSPDYRRGAATRGAGLRPGGDRFDRGVPANNFERRVRDDYRPIRSPSPRAFRAREDYRGTRGRSPDRYFRGRSRSPYNRDVRYRSRSPRARDPDDEANLSVARRNTVEVPDVQIILVDEVDRTFVTYIQQSFRDRGLRCDVLQLFRLSLVALVKRQMLEGVQAVVKIFRRSQNTGKIPLQVFDRSSGLNNVRFDEYEDLDASVAAEIVVRAKSTHLAPAPVSAQYPVGAAYGAPHYAQGSQALQQQQQPQEGGAPANITNLITSLDGPSLQKLLGAMAQSPQTSPNAQRAQPSQQPVQSQNLASLLSSVARQQVLPQQGYPYNTASQQQQYAGPVTNPSFADNPALSSLLSNANGRNVPQALPTQQHQQQPGQQQSVQDIMAQLARYKQ